VSLGLTVDAEGTDGSVSLVRGLSPESKPQFTVVRAIPGPIPGPEHATYEVNAFAASGPRGRLTIRREKAEVICLAADRPNGELQELIRLPFTARRVRYLKLHADCGGSPTGVTGRLADVTIRATEIVGGLTSQELRDERSYWWWWIPVAATALAGAAYVRARRRQADAEPWAGSNAPARAASARR
jgi:hypothetical protein